LLAGILSLTVRILLLLSWLLAAALLLARLLPGILVLLAGILVLIGHRDLPFSSREGTIAVPAFGCAETFVPRGFFRLCRNPRVPACFVRYS
jgi:hypothetical protein